MDSNGGLSSHLVLILAAITSPSFYGASADEDSAAVSTQEDSTLTEVTGWVQQAIDLSDAGSYESARELLTRAAEADPGNAQAYFERGMVFMSYESPSGFFVSGNASYASSQFSDVTNLRDNKVGNYTLVNARAGYRRDNWAVTAFVDNLFDERFVGRRGLSTVSTSSGIAEPNSQPFFAVNDPRIYGLEIRYSY